MAFNGTKVQTWSKSSADDGTVLDAEFTRLYDNDNSLNAKDLDLQQQINVIAAGIHIIPLEIKHCTGLDISAFSGLTHTMDLSQNVTFVAGDLVVSSFDMKIYSAAAGTWTFVQNVALHDAFFVYDLNWYANATPEGAMDFLYNEAGSLVVLYDMPSLAAHASSHAAGGSDQITPAMIGAEPASSTRLLPVGVELEYTGSTAPAGFVLASGGTIGSSASGASERANADTYDLFDLYFREHTDTVLSIYTSTGTPTTRASFADSAAAFAADCRMKVPDSRDRVTVGKGNMGGTAAGRITIVDTSVLLAAGGAETVTLSINEMPIHSHLQNSHGHAGSTTGNAGAHAHTTVAHNHISGFSVSGAVPRYGTAAAGVSAAADNYNAYPSYTTGALTSSASPSTATAPNHSHSVTIAAAVAVNQNTGGGAAHNNLQPFSVKLKIIKL